jgi:uncharacterized membrane protein YdjX (TVP38/TMEM64 family)
VSPGWRVMLLIATVAGLAALAFSLPLASVPAGVAQLGPVAPLVAVAIGGALLAALVPRTPVSLACGLLFGATLGTVCALGAALIAATVTFAAGRALGRDFVARRAGRYWRRLEAWIDREGVLAVATMRALPLGPYGLSGYAYGASAVRVRAYAIGTVVAGAPSALSYAMLGAAVARPGAISPLSLVPLGFGLLLSLALVVRARLSASRRRSSESVRPQSPALSNP